MTRYTCISLRQPWAWLVVSGHKDIENRKWQPRHRGQILIHASGSHLSQTYSEAKAFMADRGLDIPIPIMPFLPTRCIVGYATLTDVAENHPSPWAMENHLHWVLSHPVAFDDPISCKGQQGLFKVEADLQFPPFMGVQL